MSYKRKQGDAKRTKARNFVAKHAHEFNKAAMHADRKHRAKRGYTKHKGHWS